MRRGSPNPDGDAPKPRQGLDVFPAINVLDVDALSAVHNKRTNFLMLSGIGITVEVIGDIPGFDRVRLIHDCFSSPH